MKTVRINWVHAGYMKALIRTEVDKFSLGNAVNIEELEVMGENVPIIPVEELFNSNKSITLDDRKLELFLNGVMLTYKIKDGVYRIYNQEKFIGLGIVNNNLLKRDVIV